MKTAHLQEGRIAFQGDIGFRRVAKLPAGAKEQKVNGHIPLVNQRTGHQHTLASQGLKFYESSDPLRAYIVFQGVSEVDVVHRDAAASVPVARFLAGRTVSAAR